MIFLLKHYMEQIDGVFREYMVLKKVFLSFLLISELVFQAEAAPRYEADVSVDVTAKTVTEAKQKAISKAMRDGLNEVILGISTEDSVKEVNKLNDNQLQHFITGVMVLKEKTSDVRYIADLRISVDEKILKAYMAENNLPIALSETQEVIIIPVLEKEDGTLDVWGDENFWRQVFVEHHYLRRGNLEINTIDKNLGNIAMIKTARVYDMADEECKELADFNRADIIYVVKYSLKDKKVYVKGYPDKSVQEIAIESQKPEELVDKVLSLFKSVKKNISSQQADYNMAPTQIDVIYSYPRLANWMSLKQILDNNTQVQDIKIVSMTNNKVHFNFLYSGVIEKLQGSLEVNGYRMVREGEYYVIK